MRLSVAEVQNSPVNVHSEMQITMWSKNKLYTEKNNSLDFLNSVVDIGCTQCFALVAISSVVLNAKIRYVYWTQVFCVVTKWLK